jgi:hypothetical protein
MKANFKEFLDKIDFDDPSEYDFDADKTMIKYNRTIDWRKIKKTVEMDDVDDARKNF